MTRCIPWWLFLPALLAAGDGPVRPSKKIALFNGRDLSGFYVSMKDTGRDDPRGVFAVQNGVIRISGEAWGGLTTEQEYADYRLVVEWKWGEKTWPPRENNARDSGILIHGTGADGAGGNGWLESIEYQIIEGGTGDLILVAGAGRPQVTVEAEQRSNGQFYWKPGAPRVTRDRGRINWYGRDMAWQDRKGFRGVADLEKPVGQWNRSEIIARDGELTFRLNGRIVNQALDSNRRQGKIQIQSEGAEIFVRKIELHPLPRSAGK
ncbi:MAG: 3-keto-disaccharide hydrolase [Bryobacteraceae bacterium]